MNYVNWAMCMEAVLLCQGYWDLFEEKVLLEDNEGPEVKRIKKRMAEARATLILGVEDAQLAHMTDPNPYTIWENLAKVEALLKLIDEKFAGFSVFPEDEEENYAF
ncbi:hypothetical protein C0989_001692 [Termitomyces sp. Mn162]|nr:hypothetical protein C0989_001692 [Termitomyces sp. Mn162]